MTHPPTSGGWQDPGQPGAWQPSGQPPPGQPAAGGWQDPGQPAAGGWQDPGQPTSAGWQDPSQPTLSGQPPGYPQWQQPGVPPPGVPGGYGYPAVPQPQNTMAIVSMIISIVGAASVLCGCCFTLLGGLAIPIGGVGAILGHMASRQIKERNERGQGMALAGIIVGWIAAGLGLLFLLFGILWLVGISTGFWGLDDTTFSLS